ncbi:hypothetical protein CORC01_02754, partial [Colletotrichum orchidophilum]
QCDEEKACGDFKYISTAQSQSDGKNCGKCGTKCSESKMCCDSKCVEKAIFQNNPMNCGKWGNKCPQTYNCHSSHCLEPYNCETGVCLLESCHVTILNGSGCGAGEDELCDCMETADGNPFCGTFDGQYCKDLCNSDLDCRHSKGKIYVRWDKTFCLAVASDDGKFKGVCFEAYGGKWERFGGLLLGLPASKVRI